MTSIVKGSPFIPMPAGFDCQGHRGARGLRPENTLPAFETALDLGVTTLELDVHLTVEGEIAIWHDPVISNEKCRLDPRANVVAPDPDDPADQGSKLMIRNLSVEQLRAYRCDRNPDPKAFPNQSPQPTALAGDDYRIVTLEELFDFVDAYNRFVGKSEEQRQNAGRVHFNIETKRQPDKPETINDGFDGLNPGPFEQAILQLVARFGLDDRVIIQSFDHRSLVAIRAVNQAIRLAALTQPGMPPASAASLAAANFDIWSPHFTDVTVARLAEAHHAGLLVIPWTVNDVSHMRRLALMGVDGLISDRPDLLGRLA